MGAAAGIIGSVISGSANAGQQDTSNGGQVSHATNVSNAGGGTPQMVQPTGVNSPQVTNSGNGGGMDWSQVAEMAKQLMSKKDEEPKKDDNQVAQVASKVAN